MRVRVVAEDDLSHDHHARICDLLVSAFPRHADLFSKVSYYYARPEYRLWLEGDDGVMVAHLSFERRVIGVGDVDVLVAGVGEVATHPRLHGAGVGRALMDHLFGTLRLDLPADFGFLQCRPAVAGFYEHVGWQRIDGMQTVIEQDIHSGQFVTAEGPALVAAGTQPLTAWPTGSPVHLRGLPW